MDLARAAVDGDLGAPRVVIRPPMQQHTHRLGHLRPHRRDKVPAGRLRADDALVDVRCLAELPLEAVPAIGRVLGACTRVFGRVKPRALVVPGQERVHIVARERRLGLHEEGHAIRQILALRVIEVLRRVEVGLVRNDAEDMPHTRLAKAST